MKNKLIDIFKISKPPRQDDIAEVMEQIRLLEKKEPIIIEKPVIVERRIERIEKVA